MAPQLELRDAVGQLALEDRVVDLVFPIEGRSIDGREIIQNLVPNLRPAFDVGEAYLG